ncbi:MAG: ABC transporter ATP-binding protein [Spirochaeta sp.]|nr:ABC transporter ATP-binding protein [Spirochaeta sp.]
MLEHSHKQEFTKRSESLVELKDVGKRFLSGSEDLVILNSIDLQLPERLVTVITGESGCGKTTLLNIIGGLETPSSGSVQVSGYAVQALDEDGLTEYRRQVVGLVFQFHYLLKDFNALENILLPGYMAGLTLNAARERAAHLLDQVGLSARAEHYPTQLSGGERQRIALARALMNDPAIVLADEPTGNLDERNSRAVQETLFELVRSFGKTLIMVTHDAGIAALGDRRFHLEQGSLYTA